MLDSCSYVLTDSGGIQEEVTAPTINKRVFVLRTSTERPEAVKSGFAEIVGTEKHKILDAMKRTLKQRKKLPRKSPYGDGNAAEKIAKIIKEELAG